MEAVDAFMEDAEASVGSDASFHGFRGNVQLLPLWRAPWTFPFVCCSSDCRGASAIGQVGSGSALRAKLLLMYHRLSNRNEPIMSGKVYRVGSFHGFSRTKPVKQEMLERASIIKDVLSSLDGKLSYSIICIQTCCKIPVSSFA